MSAASGRPVTVVVAGTVGDPRSTVGCAVALRRELDPQDVLLWMGSTAPNGNPAPPQPLRGDHRVHAVAAAPGEDRGSIYALGLAFARTEHVAFTDSASVPVPGWRAAMARALAGGPVVIGGPVLRDIGETTRRSAAGFVVEYGPHTSPPYRSASGDVAANNVVYDRAVLLGVVGAGPVWKASVDHRLAGRGILPAVCPDMAVTSRKAYGMCELTWVRGAHGRQYGADRSAGWGRWRRGLAALTCVVLPALAWGRLARRGCGDPRLGALLRRAGPLVPLALASWSIGEAAGYLTARGPRTAVL